MLIYTKLQRPKLSPDILPRPQLIERLERGPNRKVTLISAPAGYGKSVLASLWLEACACPAAWLSLDGNDNDLTVFLDYFIAAIQTLFPKGCLTTHNLLSAHQTPPLDYLAKTLNNEISDLPEEFMLVLNDYHLITDKAIHQLVATLIKYPPPQMNLVIVSRQGLPGSISRLRASQAITEIRMKDLRFTPKEIQVYLKSYSGVDFSPETIAVLADRTEGWAAGLYLACMAIQGQDYITDFLETFQGTNQYVAEYLVDEVLSRQPQSIQMFLLGTSILDRFCSSLCDVVAEEMPIDIAGKQEEEISSREILSELEKTNLFITPLDNQSEWYRYHHLFKDLLLHNLKARTTDAQRAALHIAAGAWLDQNGFTEEALRHFFAADDTAAAAHLVARRRYALLNQTQWQRLEQLLHQFPPDSLDQYPDLLMLKSWLLYSQGQWTKLPAALQRLEATLAQASLTPEAIDHLQGEISALRGLLSFLTVDLKSTLAHAQQALEQTPRELWSVRILARTCLAVTLQMMGDLNGAYSAIYSGLEEEDIQSNSFKAMLVMTVDHIHWLAADLQGMAQTASQCITLSQDTGSSVILNYAHFHLGCVCYQQNDLAAAEQHFTAVVKQPYLSYGDCFAFSASGLAATYQAQGQPDKARTIAKSAVAFALETGNTALLPLVEAIQPQLALSQGKFTEASQWAARLDPSPILTPIYGFSSPHLTLVKIWLAQNTSASRQQAANLLDKMWGFCETTHNTRFLIEVLALQAYLNAVQGKHQTALDLLEQGVELAQSGGFIRLFVDLGPQMAQLLTGLKTGDSDRLQYVEKVLAAFPSDLQAGEKEIKNRRSKTGNLLEPLTNREQDVLELLARRQTNKEIAEQLVISPHTVQFHIKNIFTKLSVRSRRQAADRARELGLVSSE